MTLEFGSPAASSTGPEIEVAALVQRVDSSSIRNFIGLSDSIPVLLLFVQAGDAASLNLEKSVTSLVQKAAGAILGLVVDVGASPDLVQAFDLNQIPSAYGLLKGQPAPLFTGDQSLDQIQLVINKVLEVARENGLVSKAKVKDAIAEPEISQSVQAAYDAIEHGKYPEALAQFEKALLENPNDGLAQAGLAQVKLLIRLENKDPEQLIADTASDAESVLAKADALIATGMADQGFALLLDLFEKTPKDQREPVRARLVELFTVVGIDTQEVAVARKALSLLLF